MATVNFAELLDAVQFTGFGTFGDNAAYVCSETGSITAAASVNSTNTAALDFYRKLGYEPDAAVSSGKRLVPDGSVA